MFITRKLDILEQIVFTRSEIYTFDPNRILEAVLKGSIIFDTFDHQKCKVTGVKEVIGFQTTTMSVMLRPDVFQRLILLNLKPNEWKKLFKLFPDEHYLEGDFYDDDGTSYQSKAEFLQEILWYVPQKERPRMLKGKPGLQVVSDLNLS